MAEKVLRDKLNFITILSTVRSPFWIYPLTIVQCAIPVCATRTSITVFAREIKKEKRKNEKVAAINCFRRSILREKEKRKRERKKKEEWKNIQQNYSYSRCNKRVEYLSGERVKAILKPP